MREFLIGATRLHILHHASKEPITGVWMAAELARHGYTISPGTLYPRLHKMEREGLLTSTNDLQNGHRIRLYSITEAGLAQLVEGRRMVAELCHEVT